MSTQPIIANQNNDTDMEIRALVLSRLQTMSADSMKVIGNEGAFTRDQLIEHVQQGDRVGRIIEKVELEWLRAMKDGIIPQLLSRST